LVKVVKQPNQAALTLGPGDGGADEAGDRRRPARPTARRIESTWISGKLIAIF
jgi:hypothetical protein